MQVEINKGTTLIQLARNLSLTLSRPLKKKMVMLLLTPAQFNKYQEQKVSSQQLRTIHMVCSDLQKSDPEGKSKQELYLEFKRKYLAFEIKADHPEFNDYYDAIETMALRIDDDTARFNCLNLGYSHSHATIKQFAKSFDDFCMVYASRGASYRHPADYKKMIESEFYKARLN